MFCNILKRIDKKICNFFGIEQCELTPNSIEICKNTILINCTESYKRHRLVYDWNTFQRHYLHLLSKKDQNKLGIAIGKGLAKDLIINFNEVKLDILIKPG